MIINLTPHDVVVVDKEEKTLATFPRSEKPARCVVSNEIVAYDDNGDDRGTLFPFFKTVFGAVENLPPSDDVNGIFTKRYYIVSRIVAEAAEGRDDLLVPTVIVRDKDGRVIGCMGFSLIQAKDE